MDSASSISDSVWSLVDVVLSVPVWIWPAAALASAILAYVALLFLAPTPRPARSAEKQYVTITETGQVSSPQPLPCWYDRFAAQQAAAREQRADSDQAYKIEPAECFMTLVVPAYNEEKRLGGMLEEAVEYLQQQYGTTTTPTAKSNGSTSHKDPGRGWEIIIVSDGSTDDTVNTALNFARTHVTNKPPPAPKGPWNAQNKPTNVPSGAIRVVQLDANRGKGGAVTHGMRHARGTYVVFADADGASRFTDLGKLVQGCEKGKDGLGRAVSVGSRAHMVGTEAVVKRSILRNTLMRGFHLLIWTLTTPRVAKIKDTQCGFKLFTRQALPYIIPFMHSEGWIFDVEMLMLAESADIPMVEVPIGWKEVMGSKLNVVKDSIGMAVGLALLRVCWGIGIYKRD